MVEEYINSVIDGSRIAGKYEILAVKRHLKDLKRSKKGEFDFIFSEEKAKLAISFFSLLHHFKGEWAGQQFKLEGWQAFIVWCIFGWVDKKGYRRFNYADIVVARKNGKTTLAAGIALYMMVLDGESGAEIYSAAMDMAQAKICWEAAREIARKSPAIASYLQFYQYSIIMESSASSFKPLSRDSKNKDGLNPHCAICDERHAWVTNDLFDVIKSGLGARRQPLVFSITTAGFNMDAPYFKDLRVMQDILKGIKEQDNWFIVLYQPDKGDDWKDEKTWIKANPNYGVSVSKSYFADELQDAINKGGTTEVNFKTKNLNMWVDAPDVWIPDELVSKNNFEFDLKELDGQECYAGLDLASHKDINALALYFPKVKTCPVKFLFFVPEIKILDNEDKADYRVWREQGWLVATPGDVIDIDIMSEIIMKELRKYNVKNLSFDPYKAYHGLIQALENGGMSDILDEYTQNIANMSEPSKEIDRMIRKQELNFLDNPVIRWMFRNVTMYQDANENIRPDKRRSSGKIDGVVSLINAVGGYISLNAEKKEIYKEHTLRVVSLKK